VEEVRAEEVKGEAEEEEAVELQPAPVEVQWPPRFAKVQLRRRHHRKL